MLKVEYTGQFKKDYKNVQKRGKSISALREVVSILVEGKGLPEKYRDHDLINTKYFRNCRECHIEPDWLLVYQISDEKLILRLLRTGTHSDIFK